MSSEHNKMVSPDMYAYFTKHKTAYVFDKGYKVGDVIRYIEVERFFNTHPHGFFGNLEDQVATGNSMSYEVIELGCDWPIPCSLAVARRIEA